MPNPISTGTCTVTLNSDVVTLDATALAACQANTFLKFPDDYTGLFFRPQIGITWYRIAQAQANGTIILETPYAYDNSYLVGTPPGPQTGISFYILPRYYALNPNARQLGVFMCDFVFRPLTLLSEDQLNMIAPSRFLVSTYPQFVAEMNSNLDVTGIPKQVQPLSHRTLILRIRGVGEWTKPLGLNPRARICAAGSNPAPSAN